jgi:hypothetical protein
MECYERFYKEEAKVQKIAKVVIPIIVCVILLNWLLFHVRCNRLEGYANISFIANLERLNLSLANYANNHSGKMPNSRDWADAITGDQNLILKEDFGNASSLFGVFYNMSLSNREYSELKGDCVTLFECKGQWNSAGGKNVFYDYASRRGRTYLVTLNGNIYIYNAYEKTITRLKDNARIDPNNLIWE